jgi:uncharacterized protein (TIGR02145 family)
MENIAEIWDSVNRLEARVAELERKMKQMPTAASAYSDFFTDARDGQRYRTAKINGIVWLAENMRINIQGSIDYKSNPEYGRFYNWDMANEACPHGWHLPSLQEWDDLVLFLGNQKIAENELRARSGWNNNCNGTDDFGFSALPSGYFRIDEKQFHFIGDRAIWWTSSAGASSATVQFMESKDDAYYISIYVEYKVNMIPIRCIKD